MRRRVGNAYGLLAAAILLAGKAADPFMQARPYGLMLGFGALALVLWQPQLVPEPTPRKLFQNVALCAALCALLLSHVFGVLIWAALLAGEAWRTAQSRSLDRARVLALLLPLLVTTLYVPLFQNHGASSFPAEFQPSPNTIFEFYIAYIDRELIFVLLTALLLALLAGRSWLNRAERMPFSQPEWVVISGLICIPLFLIVIMIQQHGSFFERYGVAGSLGIAILFAALTGCWTRFRLAAAVTAIALALLVSARIPNAAIALVEGQIFLQTEPAVTPSNLASLIPADVPLVDASGLTFVEMSRREPGSLLDHTFYLTGGLLATEFAHATIYESLPQERETFRLRAQTSSYEAFIAAQHHFFVLGTYNYPEDWLLRKLLADRATLRLAASIQGSYKDHELYEVRMPDSPPL